MNFKPILAKACMKLCIASYDFSNKMFDWHRALTRPPAFYDRSLYDLPTPPPPKDYDRRRDGHRGIVM